MSIFPFFVSVMVLLVAAERLRSRNDKVAVQILEMEDNLVSLQEAAIVSEACNVNCH